MPNEQKCPIWGTEATFEPTMGDYEIVVSPRCGGKYFISRSATVMLGHDSNKIDKVRLTTWLIDQRLSGISCPKIFGTTFDDIKKQPALTVQERAERLLKYLDIKSKYVGDIISYGKDSTGQYDASSNEMFAYSESCRNQEIVTLFEYLERNTWIERKIKPTLDREAYEVMITVDGYTYLDSLRKRNPESPQAFVAMWFDDSVKPAYLEGIEPAIRDAGFKPVRIDGQQHNDKIDDAIIAEIRKSRFVVADFTQGEKGARGGVYYEAGFAHGLNIPVIFTCRKDVIEKVHFDTRQYNHIVWETYDELRKGLKNRILATIGEGPMKRH